MKAYTDINQSKLLAEFLPLESADMSFVEKGNAKRIWYDAENKRITTAYEKKYYIPCWSLSALLDIISIEHNLHGYLTETGMVYRIETLYAGNSESYNNPIDACYEFIIKRHNGETRSN